MKVLWVFAVALSLLIVSMGSIKFLDKSSGPSAGLCQDTLEDQALVDDCIRHQNCPFKGIGTSFGKFQQGLVWQNIRILMDFSGLSIHRVFLLVRFLNAMGLILLLITAWRIFGGVSAALGLVITAFLMASMDFDPWILNNSNLIFFFGAVATITGLAVVHSPRTWVILAFSAFMALIADTHIAAVPMVLSLLWIVWIARHNIRSLVIAGLTWSVVLFLLSPGPWLETIRSLGSLSAGTRGQLISGDMLNNVSVIIALLGAATGFAVIAIKRHNPQNKPMTALIAMVLPQVLVFIIAGMVTGIDTSDKYLIQVAPAIGMLAGLAIVRLIKVPVGRLFPRLKIGRGLDAPAIIAAGLILWSWPITPLTNAQVKDPLAMARLTLQETDSLVHALKRSGWTRQAALSGIKGPLYLNILEAVVPKLTETPDTSQKTGYVIRVRSGILPSRLPKNWHLIAKNRETVLYFVQIPTVLDWKKFKVCSVNCIQTGLARSAMTFGPTYTIRGFPSPAKDLHRILTLKIPINTGRMAIKRAVSMPQVPGWCSGRILSIENCTNKISENGQDATYTCRAGQKGTLVVTWRLGGLRCGAWDYDGLPPFFIETDPEDAKLMKQVISSYPQRLK